MLARLRRVPRAAWEAAAAVSLLLWRLIHWPLLSGAEGPLERLLTDWVVYLSLFWLLTLLAEGKKIWRVAAFLLMAGLLAIYLWRQLALTADHLRGVL